MENLIDSDGVMAMETNAKDRSPVPKGRVCSSVKRVLWLVMKGGCLTNYLLRTRGASDYIRCIKMRQRGRVR